MFIDTIVKLENMYCIIYFALALGLLLQGFDDGLALSCHDDCDNIFNHDQ